MKKHSKRYREAKKKIDPAARYQVGEAVSLLKETPRAGFDEMVEVSMKLGIDPRKSDQMVRGTTVLPHGTGKMVRVIVFVEGEQALRVKEAGALEAGGDELIQKITDGWLDFDVAIAVPQLMSKVGRLGRTLGPKGLMPSPRSGTVTDDVEGAVKDFLGGKIEYRADAGGNVHAPVGRLSFTNEQLKENIQSLIDHIQAARPASAKGTFIRKVHLTASMSPGIPLAVLSKG